MPACPSGGAGRGQPDLVSIEAIGDILSFTASELLANQSFEGTLAFRDYPLITLENGAPLKDLIHKYRGLCRFPSSNQLSTEPFFAHDISLLLTLDLRS